jgi:DNA helicase-2/ATP-dependent DNA helicase PcrA
MSYNRPYYPKVSANGAQPAKKKWNGYKKPASVQPGSMYVPVPADRLSDEQNAILAYIVGESRSLLVEAYAGCAKTTTIVEGMWKVAKNSPRTTQCYIVFANRNKTEAVGKCPPSANVQTAHAFGLGCLRSALGKIEVDNDKTYRIATALVGPDDEKAELRYMVAKAIDLAKDYLCTQPDEVVDMLEKHGIETGNLSEAEFCDKVLKGMQESAKQPQVVSFSDMVWLPIHLNLHIPHYDILYVDECQDLNPSRLELMFRSIGANGRGIFVGDPNQAIFGFTGADRHALPKIVTRTNAHTMGLHRTFRCGKAIVSLAQEYVPDYSAAETNPQGEVVECGQEAMMSENGAQAGDFILSRTNAPTVKIAMQLLKQGRKCCIQGKDLGSNLLYMIKRSGAKTVPEFQSWLDSWASAEIERLMSKGKTYEQITDKAACLEAFCEGMSDLSGVRERIASMFDDTEANETHRVTLSTVHKAKGLERHRVWLLESSFVCKPKTEEDQIQERNVRYVAITRAKDSLFLVA